MEGCHPSHEIRLYLEDRRDEATAKKIGNPAKPVHFSILLSCQSETLKSRIWQEGVIESVPDSISEINQALVEQKSPPKVKFSDKSTNQPGAPTGKEVKKLCDEILKAHERQR